MQATQRSFRNVARFLFFVAATLTATALVFSDTVLLYVAASFSISLSVLAFAPARDRFDLFEPIHLIGYSLVYSVALRSIYMLTAESERRDFIALGVEPDDIVANLPLFATSIGALVFGYRLVSGSSVGSSVVSSIARRRLVEHRVVPTAVALLVGASFGLGLFVLSQGITFENGFLALSRKRSILVGDTFGAAGYSRLFAQLGQYAFFMLACGLMFRVIRRRPTTQLLAVAAALSAIALPFLTSSRSTIVILGIVPLVFSTYLRKLRVKRVLPFVLIAIGVVTLMGTLRAANQTGSTEIHSVADSVLGAGNGLDFSRTTAIITEVDRRDISLGGSSYLALVSAPVPRSMWPDKPNPSLGPWVKSELFGFNVRTNGMPPGLIAEGYLNFGFFGPIAACFLFGAFLRAFYESFRPHLGLNFSVTLLYSVGVWRLAFGTIGLNIAQGIIQTLTLMIPTLLMILVVSRRRLTVQATTDQPNTGRALTLARP